MPTRSWSDGAKATVTESAEMGVGTAAGAYARVAMVLPSHDVCCKPVLGVVLLNFAFGVECGKNWRDTTDADLGRARVGACLLAGVGGWLSSKADWSSVSEADEALGGLSVGWRWLPACTRV